MLGRRAGAQQRREHAAAILLDALRDYKRLSGNCLAVHQMRSRIAPIQDAVRRRRKWQLRKSQDAAATGIARMVRGKQGREEAEVIKARIHAQLVQLKVEKSKVLYDFLAVCRNRQIVSTQALQLRMAAQQAKLHRAELEAASAQVTMAKHARRLAAEQQPERRRQLRRAADAERRAREADELATISAHDLFAPIHSPEYYGYAPSPPRSSDGGGGAHGARTAARTAARRARRRRRRRGRRRPRSRRSRACRRRRR